MSAEQRARELLRRAGRPVQGLQRLHGGDVGAVFRSGEVVVKTQHRPVSGMFPAEARGLRLLRKAGARTPELLHAEEAGLVLEYLPPGPDRPEALAEQLARLHQHRMPHYGAEQELFLATFRFAPATRSDWRELWVEQRLRPLLRATAPTLGRRLCAQVELALARDWPTEGPVAIHGDLWGGNVVYGPRGPALIDPSAQAGERVVDLGMMRLFGGFPPRFWQAYGAALPIPPEVEEAIERTQLYHLLVHVHLFGARYCRAVERAAQA